jgi:hypothetical protein
MQPAATWHAARPLWCGSSCHLVVSCWNHPVLSAACSHVRSVLLCCLPPCRTAMATTLDPPRSALLAPTMARVTRTPAHREWSERNAAGSRHWPRHLLGTAEHAMLNSDASKCGHMKSNTVLHTINSGAAASPATCSAIFTRLTLHPAPLHTICGSCPCCQSAFTILRRCPFGTTTSSTVTINVDAGYCSKYIQGYGHVNGATSMCAVRTWQGLDVTKDVDGEACTTCPVGYTTGDVGSIRVANCSRESAECLSWQNTATCRMHRMCGLPVLAGLRKACNNCS